MQMPRLCTRRSAGYFLVWVLLAAGAARAQDTSATSADAPLAPNSAPRPLWEIGLAGGVGSFADYPGSDEYRVSGLGIPYFIYRGGIFRSDASGPRLRAVAGSVEFQFTGTGSLSARHSQAREGMPGLDYLLEAGPNAKVTIVRPTPDSRVFADLPLRAAITTNFHSRLDWRGLVFSPDLAYEDESIAGSKWGGKIGAGLEFATAGLQDYFYQVDPQYARPDRPAYRAHGGYLGARLSASAYYPLTQHFNVYVAAQFDYYGGAENQASPLAKSKTGGGGIVGFAWSIWQSQRFTDNLR